MEIRINKGIIWVGGGRPWRMGPLFLPGNIFDFFNHLTVFEWISHSSSVPTTEEDLTHLPK